ncbi:alcohol dehydrogenase catalytic domain-containing protein [Candidatus Aerophobetes bacterium]|nr:alcohol dehydrogenase catalytic domain-containing protein [Candidatus Aerophobetes bacterium]
MKVAKYYSSEDIRIVDAPVPEIKEGEILVRTKVCGICGSDILAWYREVKKSLSFGHEITGVVEKVAKGVENVKEGDRVFVHHHVPCFVCHFCQRGSYTMCPTFHRTNIYPSGFAEYIRVPEINVRNGGVIPLSENVSFEEGSLIEPMACCMRGLKRARVRWGDTVLVIGAGFTGLVHTQLARMMGAGVIVICDFFDFKLEKAKKMGADVTVNLSKEDVKEKLYEVSRGRGADLVVVTPASVKAIEGAMEFLAKGGTLYFFGPTSPSEYLSLLPHDFFFSELTLMTNYSASPLETHAIYRLMEEKRITTEGLITHRFDLFHLKEAIEIAKKADKSIKVVINF